MLKENKTDILLGYLICAFAIGLLVFSIYFKDFVAIIGSCGSLFFGALALKKTYKAREALN